MTDREKAEHTLKRISIHAECEKYGITDDSSIEDRMMVMMLAEKTAPPFEIASPSPGVFTATIDGKEYTVEYASAMQG